MRKLSTVLALGFLLSAPAISAARADDWRYHGWNYVGNYWNPGESRADREIREGVRDGELSHKEVKKLDKEERNLRNEERADWADGHLSGSERRQLRDDQRDFQRDLHHQLTDDEHGRRW